MTHLTSDISSSTHASLPSQPGHRPSMKKQPGLRRLPTRRVPPGRHQHSQLHSLTGQGKLTQKSHPCKIVCGTHDQRQLWNTEDSLLQPWCPACARITPVLSRPPPGSPLHRAGPCQDQRHELQEKGFTWALGHTDMKVAHTMAASREVPPTGWESRAAALQVLCIPWTPTIRGHWVEPPLQSIEPQDSGGAAPSLVPKLPRAGGHTQDSEEAPRADNNVTSRHHHLIPHQYCCDQTWCFTAVTCGSASRWKQN